MNPEFVAHAGMVEAALNIYRELLAKHVINQAFSQLPDADIVVTGHSLGAGTATILGFILRARHSNTYVYSYGPPGGLINEIAQKEAQKFVVSVICGDDFISRLSITSIYELRTKMEQVLLQCEYPKHKILSWAVSSSLSRCLCCFWCLKQGGDKRTAKWHRRLAKSNTLDHQDQTNGESEFESGNDDVEAPTTSFFQVSPRRGSSAPILQNDLHNETTYGSVAEVTTPRSTKDDSDGLVVLESQIVGEPQHENNATSKTDTGLGNETKDQHSTCNKKISLNSKHNNETIVPKMFPPGKLIHLLYGNERKTWNLKYVTEQELSDIRVSEFMATDHFPQEYVNGLTYISGHLMNNTLVHI